MGTWLKRNTSKKYVISQDQRPMDLILDGLGEAQLPDQVKANIIQRICEQGADSSQPASTVKGVFQVCCKWVVHGMTSLQVSSGFQLLNQWGTHHLKVFQAFFTPQLVAEMLTPGYGNEANVPLLIREGFRVMNNAGPHIFHEHVNVVQNRVTKFIRGCSERIVVRNVTLLLSEFSECCPSTDAEVLAFCMALIHHLSVGVLPADGKEIVRAINLTDEITSYLSLVWRLHPPGLLADCLAEIFRIISSPLDDTVATEPAICLAPIVQHIPIEMASRVVKDVVTDPNVTDQALVAAVGQMVEWLKWPTSKNVDLWLSCFLTELAAAHKFSLLVSITENNTIKVLENMSYGQLRSASFRVLSIMLLSFQHSPGPFHKGLEKLPEVVYNLRKENSAHSHHWLAKLSTLTFCLMYQHSGFPELYEPILDLIKDQKHPSVEEIKTQLQKSQWLAQVSGSAVAMETTSLALVSSVKQEKLEPGKTGLENLGNTCYMNSVLQTLYMCDQFRQGILSKAPSGGENLLVKLQHIFSMLSQSLRPAVAPRNFLLASRPPWFLPGHQQDCSEFLKYLLDQLHENEISNGHRILRNSPSSSSLNGSGSSNNHQGGSKKGEVTLMAVKLKSDDEMNGHDPSNCDRDSSPVSLVEKTFRGKVQTTMRCLACGQQSQRVESFADLPLAFPNSPLSSQQLSQNNLAGGSVHPASSTHSDSHSDKSSSGDGEASAEDSLKLTDLIAYYLKKEKLTGENQYHCDSCGRLQDGERSIRVLESPQYLILTLLRFTYDTCLQTRTKIFHNVQYPRTLSLPVVKPSRSQNHSRSNSYSTIITTGKNNNNEVKIEHDSTPKNKVEELLRQVKVPGEEVQQPGCDKELYGLCGVIVHSGVSSECGHYYCYARHSQSGQIDMNALMKAKDNKSDPDLLPDKWYNFNDSRVLHANFSSFSNVTKKFSKDTAYVLMYRKLDTEGQETNLTPDPPLRTDLRDAVMKDNEKFLKERELEAKARETQRQRSASVNSTTLHNWRDDDDGPPPPGCGGGGGFDTSGARCVF